MKVLCCVLHKNKAFLLYVSRDYLSNYFTLKILCYKFHKHEHFHMYESGNRSSDHLGLKVFSCKFHNHKNFHLYVLRNDYLWCVFIFLKTCSRMLYKRKAFHLYLKIFFFLYYLGCVSLNIFYISFFSKYDAFHQKVSEDVNLGYIFEKILCCILYIHSFSKSVVL